MLDGNPTGAGACVITRDFKVLQNGIRAMVDFDGPPVSKIETTFLEFLVRFHAQGFGGRDKVIGSRQLKMGDHRIGGKTVPEVHHVIHNRRPRRRARHRYDGIGGGQGGASHPFQVDAVVGSIEVNQRLTGTTGGINAGMNQNAFVGRVLCRPIHGGLNIVTRENLVGTVPEFGRMDPRHHRGQHDGPEQ